MILRFLKVRFFLYALVVVFALLLNGKPATAAINNQISFQGKLTNTDGTNVTNGTYSIVFSIYTVSSGGSAVWAETQSSVSVTDGIFRVSLGSITSLPGSVDFNGASLYLGIKVGADAEMTPRVQFTAVPYAFNSDKLGGVASSGFLQLGPSAVQADGTTNSSIFINKTAAGNLIQLQASATDIFTISNAGDLTFGQNANHTISVLQRATNAAGRDLTLAAGQGGAGASANAGGNLVLQGGAGAGTNGNGGNITLAAGALNGSGAVGTVLVKNPSDSTTAFQIQNAAGTQLFVADSTNTRIYIGNPTADAVATELVLDTYNTAGDPANGVNGAMYYNSAQHMYRCYRGINATAGDGSWGSCSTLELSRSVEFNEEFMGGLTTTGNIGSQGWTLNTITACTAPQYNTTVLPSADRPGILKMNTAATANRGCTLSLQAGSWQLAQWNTFSGAVAAGSATNPSQVLRVGLHNETTTTTAPTTGVWWEANPSVSTFWRYCYTNAGPTVTCANSATTIVANAFVTLEIRITALGTGASSADFFINGTKSSISGVTINTTNRVSPAMTCYAATAVAQACYADYLQFRGTASAYR